MADQEIARLIVRLVGEVGDLKKQLVDVQKNFKDTADNVDKHTKNVKGFFGRMSESAGAVQGALRILTANAIVQLAQMAKQIASAGVEFMEFGAKAQAVKESFDYVTKSMQVDGDSLISNVKRVSGVYVDETEIMLGANKLLVAGISPEQIVKLFESARVAARLMGTSVQESFELITRAVLTFQARGLLKQAFPMEAEKVMERYAQSMQMDVDMLSEFGKQNAMVNEILKQTQERMTYLGDVTVRNHYENIQLLKSAYMEAKEMVAKFVVDGVMFMADALQGTIGLIEKYNNIMRSIGGTIEGIVRSTGEFLGLVKKEVPTVKPIEIDLAVSHKADLELAVSHGKAAKIRSDKDIADEDKLQKALTKLRLDAEKARVDAAGQVRLLGLEAQHSQALTQATLTAKDTFDIDQKYQHDKARMELENTIASLKAQEAVEIAAAVSEKKTREIPTIKTKIRQAELIAEAKYNEALDKLNLDRVTKEKERALGLASARAKGEISIQQANLNILEELFNRHLITVEDYYNRRRDLVTSIGKIEIQNLQAQYEAEGDIVKEAELHAQIVEKTTGLEKELLDIQLQLQEQTGTFLEGWERGITEAMNEMKTSFQMGRDAVKDFVDVGTSSVKGFFDKLIDGTMSARDALRELPMEFSRAVLKMVVDIGMLILKMMIFRALSAAIPGLGGVGAAVAGAAAGGQYGGRVVGPSGTDRVRANLTADEWVIRKEAAQYYGNSFMGAINNLIIPKPSFNFAYGGPVVGASSSGGGSREEEGRPINIVNVLDNRMMDLWLASAGGKDSFLNFITVNSGTIKRRLR